MELVAATPEFIEGVVPVAVDGAGNAFIAYTLASGAGGMHVRMREASGAWGPEQALGGEHMVDPELVVSANGTALLAWRQHGGKALNGTQIALSTRAPGSAFTPATVIAGTPRHGDEPAVAVNDRGDAVVTWIETHRSDRRGARRGETVSSIHGQFRQAGRGFGKSVRLSHIQAAGQSVAVTPDGRMVLAWTDWTNRRVEARVRSSTGVLGRAYLLTHDLGVNARINALAGGRGAVGWIDRDPGLCSSASHRRPRIVASARPNSSPASTVTTSTQCGPPRRPASPLSPARPALPRTRSAGSE